MKKLYLIILSLLFIPFHAKGQCECVSDKLTVSNPKIFRSGDEVIVSFHAQAEQRAIKGSVSYVFSPMITNGEHKVSLPAVIVRGKHAERIQHRNQQLSVRQTEQLKFQIARPGEALVYSASVPFQQWIAGAALVMESGSWGCNASETYPEQLLADNILAPATTTIAAATTTVQPSYSRTIGDTLASIFSFIFPASQWKDGEPIYDEDREEALLVYYPIGKHNIQADFKDNRITLNNLLAVINTILTAPDSEITRISIAGFSSPEGSFARNDRLAWERAVSVKEYIVKNTKIKSDAIHLYNGSEDWQGLRAMVAASDLYDKAEILRIIDTVPLFSADGRRKERLQQLKKLNGGVSYRYMSAYFFPQLRNSAFIRVYYNNK